MRSKLKSGLKAYIRSRSVAVLWPLSYAMAMTTPALFSSRSAVSTAPHHSTDRRLRALRERESDRRWARLVADAPEFDVDERLAREHRFTSTSGSSRSRIARGWHSATGSPCNNCCQ